MRKILSLALLISLGMGNIGTVIAAEKRENASLHTAAERLARRWRRGTPRLYRTRRYPVRNCGKQNNKEYFPTNVSLALFTNDNKDMNHPISEAKIPPHPL